MWGCGQSEGHEERGITWRKKKKDYCAKIYFAVIIKISTNIYENTDCVARRGMGTRAGRGRVATQNSFATILDSTSFRLPQQQT